MAVTANIYTKAMLSAYGSVTENLAADTVKTSLHTSTYTPAQDTDQFYSNLTNELAASGNYATGGATVSPLTLSVATSKTLNVNGSNAAWTNISMSAAARIAVVYTTGGGTGATNALEMYVNFGADQNVQGANFTIAWTGGTLFSFTVS